MHIALAQLPGIEGNIKANLDSALDVIARHGDEVAMIIFPETHLTGFAEPRHVENRAIRCDGEEIAQLIDASRRHDCAIAIGFLEQSDSGVYNTTVLITPESGIALRYSKTHLWPDERDLVLPGNSLGTTQWRGLTIGLMICYDIEFPETARALGILGADLMVVTNGNMDPYGPVHARAAQARAQDNQCFVAMTNRCGTGAGCKFAGESALFSPLGETLFQAQRLPGVHRVTLAPELLRSARRDYNYLADRRLGLTGEPIATPEGKAWQLPDFSH
jgi:(R)-amidase